MPGTNPGRRVRGNCISCGAKTYVTRQTQSLMLLA